MRKQAIIILLLFMTAYNKTVAQDVDDDAALWLTLNAEKALNERLSIHAGQQLRMNNNFADAGQFTTTVGGQYKVRKGIRVSADYAFRQRRRLDASYSLRHQFFISVFLRKKINRFTIVYRNRTQAQYNDWLTSPDGATPRLYNRNKLTIKRELNKKWEGYLAGELNLPIGQPQRLSIDRSRFFAGMIYTFSRQLDLEAYFMLQRRYTYTDMARRDFVYGFTLNYSF